MKIISYSGIPQCAQDIRKTVFVDEQGFTDEFDEIDDIATHLVIFDEQEHPIATCRIFKGAIDNAYMLGRFAVRKEYRGKHIGTLLLKAAEDYVKSIGGNSLLLHAQCQVVEFYQKCGFQSYGAMDYEQDCPHQWMKKNLLD